MYERTCGVMNIKELLCGIEIAGAVIPDTLEISGITNDSRKVQEGFAFVAVRGYESDGHKFIPAAVKNGAALVICEEKPEENVPYVIVSDSRACEGLIAANFYGNPQRSLRMIGVTGTNGKTTTTNLIRNMIIGATGDKVGLIGTNRNIVGDNEEPAERTTPDSIELMQLLRRMVDAGCKWCVMEVSSHALYLGRVNGICFSVGAFTNLTEDHLDFHKTMDAYAEAKAKLFKICDKAVINLDDEYSELMISAAECPVYTFSAVRNDASLTAKDIRLNNDGIAFACLTDMGIQKVKLGIPGLFSVYNALTALSVAINLGLDEDKCIEALAATKGVLGRAEIVPTDTDFTVMIDYAHTPDALENILKTVRGYAKGRVILLFGCGGDRDAAKRPIMGAIAARLADLVVVTSDNPRTEEPMSIINAILDGMKGSKTPVKVIENRREAIAAALKLAQANDIVILAGKGHEDYQIIGKEKHHFDEREVVRDILKGENK